MCVCKCGSKISPLFSLIFLCQKVFWKCWRFAIRLLQSFLCQLCFNLCVFFGYCRLAGNPTTNYTTQYKRCACVRLCVCVCVCVCVCQRKTNDRADGMREKSAHSPRRDSNRVCVCVCVCVCVYMCVCMHVGGGGVGKSHFIWCLHVFCLLTGLRVEAWSTNFVHFRGRGFWMKLICPFRWA